MSQFGELQADAEARFPPDSVNVPVSAWSPEWEERPKDEVCLGLRPVPPRDIEDARKAAADSATALFPRAVEGEPFFSLWERHYYDMLLRAIVARGTCDPNDVVEPWDGWRDDPDDLARINLTTEGAQLIFDAWERMRIAQDPSIKPAKDDDVEDLVDLVSDIDKLPRARALRVRRLLAFCLDEVRTIESPNAPTP